jgi:hypothetical protein
MYRYTLKVKPTNGELQGRPVKAAIDRALLFARTPVTFRFGKMAQEDSAMLVELATDLSRPALAALLRPVEAAASMRVDSIGWGWIVSDAAPGDPRAAMVGDISHDEYAFAEAQQAADQVYKYSARQPLRLFFSVAVGLFLILLVLFGIVLDTPLRGWIDSHDYIWLLVWLPLYVINTSLQIQLSPVIFVSFIRCDLAGIEIKYWFRRPVRIAWKEMTELDTTLELGTLRSPARSLKIPIGQALGMNQTSTLFKTVLERASLHYIGFVPGKGAVFKCYDAE